MLDDKAAAAVAREWILARWNPAWEPAVLEVEDAGTYWRVFYTSSAHLESEAGSDELVGNLPLLVAKSDGRVTSESAPLLEDESAGKDSLAGWLPGPATIVGLVAMFIAAGLLERDDGSQTLAGRVGALAIGLAAAIATALLIRVVRR